MNYGNESNLKKALISQTCNKNLAKAIVDAIEEDLKKPKPKAVKSILQLAIEKEKGKSKETKLFHDTNDSTEE